VNLEYERLLVGGVARISARTKPEKAAEGFTQRRLALKFGKASSDRWAAEVRQAKEEAHQLHAAGRKNDTVAAGIASGSAIRTAVWVIPNTRSPTHSSTTTMTRRDGLTPCDRRPFTRDREPHDPSGGGSSHASNF
jgi:hypothetical protein